MKMTKSFPNLAESWKPIDDTTWEFKLREDVVSMMENLLMLMQ